MNRRDDLWALVSIATLAVAIILQGAELARLRKDMQFVQLAASAAFTGSET
jgi:hypothetical protein